MKIIIASANLGKLKEFKALLPNDEVIPYKQIVGDIEIIEDGNSFQENAIIKVKAIAQKLKNTTDTIIISDDSGISVPILNNEPNIYSARYAKENATDKENNDKLISKLKEQNIKQTPAFYTAAIAMMINGNIYTVHGWMYGSVIDTTIGNGGFGYDPMFIPNGYNKTLGELNFDTKKIFSHRTKALNLAMLILSTVTNL